MPSNILQKGLNLLLKRQTSILSAAYVIMATVVLSQILGLIRQRLLVSIFGASNTLGIYFYSTHLPDTLFQLTIAAALSSAFIPVFSDYLTTGREKDGHHMASTLLAVGCGVFLLFAIVLAVFAPFFLQIFNLGMNFTPEQMNLMVTLMRIVIVGQFLFIIGTFFAALLQSYDHFFLPGIAAALYNAGMIIGILTLSPVMGIYAAPVGGILGGLIFVGAQLPLAKKLGFSFIPSFSETAIKGMKKIGRLMWPRAIAIVIFQLGTLTIASFISFLADPGRMNVIFDFAKTLGFAPVALIGQAIAQAAFPVLSRERDRLDTFRVTFLSSFNQMLYLILPISVIILVLRIPIVRLVYGAPKLDWPATVLTGKVLAFFALSIFAQALIALIYRAFYALHNTKIPLIVGAITTTIMLFLAYLFIVIYHLGVISLAIAYSIASILQLILLLAILSRLIGKLSSFPEFLSLLKLFFCTFFTAFALYIPIKLLDQLVFDTTRTINLIMLTGISSLVGLSLYLFLTWFFDITEAHTYILMFRKVGNWREILEKSDEPFDQPKL